MTLQSMRFDRRRWRSVFDVRGVVHYGTRLTKKEAAYPFRLADNVRSMVPCGECGAKEGSWCVRKLDGKSMSNHSYRVRQACLILEQRVLPNLDRLHYTLCSTLEGTTCVVVSAATDQSVDCMSCLVAAARQGG